MNPFGRAQMVMYVVYVLQDKYGKTYKGLTSNIEKRLRDHISGNTHTTSLMDTSSLRVIYTETVNSLQEARVRENI